MLTGRNGSRPSIFYPTARAKYDAWVAGSAKYSGGEGEQAARERYIAIAGSVGWKGEGLDEDDVEIDFDEEEDDEDETETRPKKEGGGLGPRVSGLETQGATDQCVRAARVGLTKGMHLCTMPL